MITNQGYCLLIVKVELSDMLELIKHQMMILMKLIKLLEIKFTQIKEPRR